MSDINFIDEMLLEIEQKEEEKTQAYYDLLLLQINNLQENIANNFNEADKEVAIIKDWALKKNSIIQERINFIERKLEAYIRELKMKTLELPNGTLKLHRKPDKVEITDMELFLKKANKDLVTIIPESFKPDLNKIKAYIKTKPTPPGVTITAGKEEFSYKLKDDKEINKNGRSEEETGTGIEQTSNIRIAV